LRGHHGVIEEASPPVGHSLTCTAGLGRRAIDNRIGHGIDEPRVAVVELHEVGRLSLGAVHLDDLAVLIWMPDDVAVNADAVADCSLHIRTSSSGAVPRGWQLPA